MMFNEDGITIMLYIRILIVILKDIKAWIMLLDIIEIR